MKTLTANLKNHAKEIFRNNYEQVTISDRIQVSNLLIHLP